MGRGKRIAFGLGPIGDPYAEDERSARRRKRRRITAQPSTFLHNSSPPCPAGDLVLIDLDDEGNAVHPTGFPGPSLSHCIYSSEETLDVEYVEFLDSLALRPNVGSDAYYDYTMACGDTNALNWGTEDDNVAGTKRVDDFSTNPKFVDSLLADVACADDVNNVEVAAVNGDGADIRAVDDTLAHCSVDGLGAETLDMANCNARFVESGNVVAADGNVVAADAHRMDGVDDVATAHAHRMNVVDDVATAHAHHMDVVDRLRDDTLLDIETIHCSLDNATAGDEGVDRDCDVASRAKDVVANDNYATARSVGDNGGNDVHIDNVNSRLKDDCVVDGSLDGQEDTNDGNADASSEDDIDEDDAFGGVDPSYKMFLENLRRHGKSYVVKICIIDDVSVCAKYETDNELHAVCNEVIPVTAKDRPMREDAAYGKALRRVLRKGKIETKSGSRKKTIKTSMRLESIPLGKRGPVIKNQLEKEVFEPPACRADRHMCKKPRLETFSVSRRQKTENGAMLGTIRARERNSSAVAGDKKKEPADPVLGRARWHTIKSHSPNVGGNQVPTPGSGNSLGRDLMRTESNSQENGLKTRAKSRKVQAKERMTAVVEREVKMKTADPVSFTAFSGTAKITPPEVLGSIDCKNKCEAKLHDLNETCRKSRKSLNQDGRPGVLKHKAGPKLTHGSDDSHSSDLEVLGTGNGASCGEHNSPFVTSKQPSSLIIIEDDMQCNGNCGSARSTKFKTRLIKVLDRAYNEKEYLELMAKVSCKKPVERERMLRSSTKQYPSDIMGKSYLEQHRDFAELINSAIEDRPKCLFLLRGFFYWLENLTQEGTFMPWLHTECLSQKETEFALHSDQS